VVIDIEIDIAIEIVIEFDIAIEIDIEFDIVSTIVIETEIRIFASLKNILCNFRNKK
jgi:hypothetical protein